MRPQHAWSGWWGLLLALPLLQAAQFSRGFAMLLLHCA